MSLHPLIVLFEERSMTKIFCDVLCVRTIAYVHTTCRNPTFRMTRLEDTG